MTKAKKQKMSAEEEVIQRSLGTLPKFEVIVERDLVVKSHARIYVTASDEITALSRAKIFAKAEEADDTRQTVAWADDSDGVIKNVKATSVREIGNDDYMFHRFSSH